MLSKSLYIKNCSQQYTAQLSTLAAFRPWGSSTGASHADYDAKVRIFLRYARVRTKIFDKFYQKYVFYF